MKISRFTVHYFSLTPTDEARDDENFAWHPLTGVMSPEQHNGLHHRPQKVNQDKVLQHRREERTHPGATGRVMWLQEAGERGDDEGYVETNESKADIDDDFASLTQ